MNSNRKIYFILFYLITFLTIFSISGHSQDSKSLIDSKVNELLLRMTLEEKIGQMMQISLEAVSDTGISEATHQLDMQKLEEAILDYHVGSIFNVNNNAFTPSQWQNIIRTIQEIAFNKTRLAIPIIYGIDAVHGANFTIGATIFPHNIGLAATWNTELIKTIGEITATETRASGIHWNFSPVLGVGRQHLWPRFYETFGEDPFLVSTLGAALIEGLEGGNIAADNKVSSCMKHFIGASFPQNGKDRTPAWIPERYLYELFLPPFKAGLEAGAHTIMLNSSEINGIPVHSNKHLVTDILRNDLSFEGVVVSDWEDISRLHTMHRIADSPKEAVFQAINAGIDIAMLNIDYSFFEYLIELVEEGRVSTSRIDESVYRILKLKFQLDLFDNPFSNPKLTKKIGSDEFKKINLQSAHQSITLLKNSDNLLPLSKDEKILITGSTSSTVNALCGGWTYTWQGNVENSQFYYGLSILEAIKNKIGSESIYYTSGIDIVAVTELAKKCDYAIVCLGENPYAEMYGNINDLSLPPDQIVLINAIKSTGTPIVLVLVEGRPRIINDVVDKCDGIILAYLPGMEGGQAIADILFGDYNPGGRLPFTYPRYPNDLGSYDYKNSEIFFKENIHFEPQYPFGYGLSYTKFEYYDLLIDKDRISQNDTLNISIKVKNIGDLGGFEVVQLYIKDLYASITPPARRLKRFRKIHLEPDEIKSVNFKLTKDDFSFIGLDNKPIIEEGKFEIYIGNLVTKFELK